MGYSDREVMVIRYETMNRDVYAIYSDGLRKLIMTCATPDKALRTVDRLNIKYGDPTL